MKTCRWALVLVLCGVFVRGVAAEEVWESGDGKKAAVVFFVLEDCPVSNALVPAMERIIKEYRPKGVKFRYAYINPRVTDVERKQHVKDYGLSAATVVDGDHKAVAKAGATVTPEAAIFWPDGSKAYCGRINNLYVGFGKKRQVVNQHDLREALEAVLAGEKEIPAAKAKAVGCYIADFKR